MNTIYKPKGAAAEYGDYAVNIYTGCPHRCYYCFAPQVLHRDREAFHSCVEPRKGIVAELRRKLEREKITGKLVHLCFTCDPYPTGCDTTATREVIQTLKEFGNHVQILTKGSGICDFDLLDGGDWYGGSALDRVIVCRYNMSRAKLREARRPGGSPKKYKKERIGRL